MQIIEFELNTFTRQLSNLITLILFTIKYLSEEGALLTEICKKCAECCKQYPFIELSKSDVYSLKNATGMHSDVFTNRKGKQMKEYFMQFQNNGYCFFLNENNGRFSCDVYEARPYICRNFPAKAPQQEVCDSNIKRFLS